LRISHLVRRRLRAERNRRGLSQAEVAETAGMSVSALQGMEAGRHEICVEHLDPWLSALEIDVAAVWPQLRPGEGSTDPVPVERILEASQKAFGLRGGGKAARSRRGRDARAMAGLVAVELDEVPRRLAAAKLDWSVSSLSRQVRRMRRLVAQGRHLAEYERVWSWLRRREGL